MINKRCVVFGVYFYDGLVGGWGVLKVMVIVVCIQMDVFEVFVMLLCINQLDGFDCLGCVWLDKEYKLIFQFCENGVKVVIWEVIIKWVMFVFFVVNIVFFLLVKSDFELEGYGCLIYFLVYDWDSDILCLVVWE